MKRPGHGDDRPSGGGRLPQQNRRGNGIRFRGTTCGLHPGPGAAARRQKHFDNLTTPPGLLVDKVLLEPATSRHRSLPLPRFENRRAAGRFPRTDVGPSGAGRTAQPQILLRRGYRGPAGGSWRASAIRTRRRFSRRPQTMIGKHAYGAACCSPRPPGFVHERCSGRGNAGRLPLRGRTGLDPGCQHRRGKPGYCAARLNFLPRHPPMGGDGDDGLDHAGIFPLASRSSSSISRSDSRRTI